MSTMPASSIPLIWWRRSDIDVATEHLLVAEVRNACADGAGGRSAARRDCDPDPDHRNSLQQSRLKCAAGVPRLYRPRVQKSEILGTELRYHQGERSRGAGPI